MPVEEVPDDYESVIRTLDDLKTRVEALERDLAALRPKPIPERYTEDDFKDH